MSDFFTSGSAFDEDQPFFTDGLVSSNQNQGKPTLNGASSLGWFGNLLDGVSGAAGKVTPLVTALKGTGSTPKATTSTVTGKPLGGMSTKTLLYIGGGIVALVLVVFLLKRK